MFEWANLFWGLVASALLLAVTYAIGVNIRRRFEDDVRTREFRVRDIVVSTGRKPAAGWEAESASLVHGSVVLSVDHFQRFLAGLYQLIGGEVSPYGHSVRWGRRAAEVRMKEMARSRGFNAVLKVKHDSVGLVTSDGSSPLGMEFLASGTAVRLCRSAARQHD